MGSRVAKTLSNASKCICVKCPSYSFGCMLRGLPGNLLALAGGIRNAKHMEGMFCSFGQSKCLKVDKGCICLRCSLYVETGLDKKSYCLQTGGK